MRRDEVACWAMLERACGILDDHKPGLGLPILEALSARGYSYGVLELARRFESVDGVYDARQRAAVLRLAMNGDAVAAQALAVDYRNRGDLASQRRWLWHAARLGDDDARAELKAFRTRWPYQVMKRWHRYAARQPG